MKVLFSEIEKMTPAQWRKCVEEMVEITRQPVNDEIKALSRSIAAFERRHGLDSETMREKVYNEEIDETRDICEWLTQLNERDRLSKLSLPK